MAVARQVQEDQTAGIIFGRIDVAYEAAFRAYRDMNPSNPLRDRLYESLRALSDVRSEVGRSIGELV